MVASSSRTSGVAPLAVFFDGDPPASGVGEITEDRRK